MKPEVSLPLPLPAEQNTDDLSMSCEEDYCNPPPGTVDVPDTTMSVLLVALDKCGEFSSDFPRGKLRRLTTTDVVSSQHVEEHPQ